MTGLQPGNIEADLYLGAWTPVSTYVYERAPVQVTRGRPNESSQITSAQCTATLNNRDGRFTVNNPVGAYYGSIGRNTPFRVSVLQSVTGGTTYLRMEDDNVSNASCPDAAGLNITGSLDIRADIQPSGYGGMLIAAKWAATGNERSWALYVQPGGQLKLRWSPDGTDTNSLAGQSALPLPLGRLAVRATMDATTGNVTLYTGPAGGTDGSAWTQLGPVISGAGATSVYAGTAGLTVGYNASFYTDFYQAGIPYAFELNLKYAGMNGAVYDFEVRSGIAGTVVAHPEFSSQTAGATSWADPQSNTWTVSGTAEISGRDYRFHGEMSSWPKAADPSAKDVYSQATASGVTRRLQQGQSPLQSAMYRGMTRLTGDLAPVAYWPCEDASGASRFASATGGPPLTFTGSPQIASSTVFACSAALPVLNGSTWTGIIPQPQSVTWTANVLRYLMYLPSGETSGAVISRMYTTGVIAWSDLVLDSGGGLTWNEYNSAGTLLASNGPYAYGVTGQLLRVSVELKNSGTEVNDAVATLTAGAAGALDESVTLTATQVGAVTKVVFNPNGTLKNTAIGHVSVQAAWDSLFDLAGPLDAWSGEPAAYRVMRLCGEEGVNARCYGHPPLSAAMGNQTQQTLMDLLQECETTDQGMLYEPRTVLGLGYRTCTSLYNQVPATTLVFSSQELAAAFAGTEDDQLTLNDVTMTAADGSSSRQVLETGTMSVLAPPDGVGRVDTSITVNPESDGQLDSLANWKLWTATYAGDRYPVIPVEMARPETPLSAPGPDIGDMVQVTGTPSWLEPGPINQLQAGTSETLTPFTWGIGVNAIPETPYEVAVAGVAHADTDGSQLASSYSSSATSLSVEQSAGSTSLWTTSGGDFPFSILVGGEEMTVTNITGSSSPQTFTVTRSVNGVVKAQAAGAAVVLYNVPVAAL